MNCYKYEACEYNAQPMCCLPDDDVCPHGVERKRPTNADRIRAMSDEELADQLVISLDGMAPCRMWAAPATGKMYLSGTSAARDMLAWLQQPAPEDGE